MSTKRALQLLLVILAVVAWVQVPLALERLPERVATHFDGAGNANGWMTHDGLFAFWSGLVGFLLVMFGGLVTITSNIPDRWINLPHKDYWFAPERRRETFERIANFGLVAGCACMAFMAVTIRALLRANLDGTQRLDERFLPCTVVFIMLVVASSVAFTVRFYRLPRM